MFFVLFKLKRIFGISIIFVLQLFVNVLDRVNQKQEEFTNNCLPCLRVNNSNHRDLCPFLEYFYLSLCKDSKKLVDYDVFIQKDVGQTSLEELYYFQLFRIRIFLRLVCVLLNQNIYVLFLESKRHFSVKLTHCSANSIKP